MSWPVSQVTKRTLAILAASLLTAAAPPPAVTPGYQPQDADERGLWMQVDEYERQFKTSNFVMHEPDLNAYVRRVFCKTVGEAECRDVRIYVVRTPYFNASMAPNGMMQVWSGLFLRCRNEAQLAAVLGHEYTHYRQRHSVKLFRDVKTKTNTLAWLSMIPVGGYAVAAGFQAAQIGIVGSIFSNSREMEREADAGSLPMLVHAGYDPTAAARIWGQIRAEDEATAAERKRRRRREGGMFASHPTSLDRQKTLDAGAAALASPSATTLAASEYRQALAPYWASFIDDQIKLNDFGATDLLLGQLASTGWTGDLLYARGELYRSRGKPGDFALAATAYNDALKAQAAPVETWRGLGIALMRSGDAAGGRTALAEYLKRAPQAKDRDLIASMAGVAA